MFYFRCSATLMAGKQIDVGDPANILQESIGCIADRRFFGPRILPLPSYMLYLLGCGRSERLLGAVSTIFFVQGCFVLWKTYGAFQRKAATLSFALVCGLFLPVARQGNRDNSNVASFFAASLVYSLASDKAWYSSVLLGMAVSSDPLCLVFFIPFLCSRLRGLYRFMINPAHGQASIARNTLKVLVQTQLLPCAIFVSSVLIDMQIRNRHGLHAREYTLAYQASLKDFSISSGLHSDAAQTPSSTDLYVMDRSVVSIVNIKHKGFLSFPKNQAGDRDACYFEIQKIHEKEFDDEEPRFIGNNDTVKLKSIGRDVFMGIKEKPEKSDDKFTDVIFDTFANDYDFWRVECTSSLKARTEAVRFVHVHTGLILGCTRTKNTLDIHGSIYSEKRSRLFYIAENRNHSYYKTHFKDQRTKEQVTAFPGLPTRLMFSEYLAGIKRGGGAGNTPFGQALFFANLIGSTVFALAVLINHVFRRRYGGGLGFDDLTYLLCGLFLLNGAGSLIWGVNSHLLYISCASFNISALVSIRAESAEILCAGTNKKHI